VRRALALAALLMLPACGPGTGPATESGPPQRLVPAGSGQTLHLVGELSGTLPGLGPRVDVEAWLRGDGWARVTFRGEDDGRPTHEVLVWTPEACLLFDATTGRFTDLGGEDGTLEALSNAFRLNDAVFLLNGRDPVWPGAEPTDLIGGPTRFRGVRESGTLRRDGDEAGMRWLDDSGTIHDIAVSYEDYLETDWGGWPARITVTGTELDAAARLQWERLDPIVVLGDSIFDPLWEPDPR